MVVLLLMWCFATKYFYHPAYFAMGRHHHHRRQKYRCENNGHKLDNRAPWSQQDTQFCNVE